MKYVAIQMLFGDRAKLFGLIFSLAFASFWGIGNDGWLVLLNVDDEHASQPERNDSRILG